MGRHSNLLVYQVNEPVPQQVVPGCPGPGLLQHLRPDLGILRVRPGHLLHDQHGAVHDLRQLLALQDLLRNVRPRDRKKLWMLICWIYVYVFYLLFHLLVRLLIDSYIYADPGRRKEERVRAERYPRFQTTPAVSEAPKCFLCECFLVWRKASFSIGFQKLR